MVEKGQCHKPSIHIAKSNLIRIKNIALMYDVNRGILIHLQTEF